MRKRIVVALTLATLSVGVCLSFCESYFFPKEQRVNSLVQRETGIKIAPLTRYGYMVALEENRPAINALAYQLVPQNDHLANTIQQKINAHWWRCLGLSSVMPVSWAEPGNPFYVCMYGVRGWTAALLEHLKQVAPDNIQVQSMSQNLNRDTGRYDIPSKNFCKFTCYGPDNVKSFWTKGFWTSCNLKANGEGLVTYLILPLVVIFFAGAGLLGAFHRKPHRAKFPA